LILQGCKNLWNTPVFQKQPLSLVEILNISSHYFHRTSHDNLLFHAQLLFGFFGLLQLGELTYDDDLSLDNPRKMPLCESAALSTASASFSLPHHKANHFYEGNKILVLANSTLSNPIRAFHHYLKS
jgi:hypothetical protein